MRDKNNHRNYDADDMEAELNDREAAYEAAIENDKIVFSAIPDAKPATRPKSDDAKILAMLKRTKLLPPDAALQSLTEMLDSDAPDHKTTRSNLLASLQSLPTTKSLEETYKYLAHNLTYHDKEAASNPTLFNYHVRVGA